MLFWNKRERERERERERKRKRKRNIATKRSQHSQPQDTAGRNDKSQETVSDRK